MKNILLIVAVFFALFFLFGCSQYAQSYADEYKSGLDPSNKLGLFNYGAMDACRNTSCVCVVCDSERSIFSDLSETLRNASWRSLSGICEFVKPCNETVFGNYWGQDDKEIRMFMIGQGSSFLDFNDANPYCKSKLNLAVKWLVASNLDPYEMPKKDRADCFLGYGVMPLYILYSGGKDVNINRTGDIAQELRDLGPVIITTEIDFNSSDSDILNNVSEQIRKIDLNCAVGGKRMCLTALAPRMGDYEGVNKFFTQYPDLLDKVDIIAYGINTRYSKKCDNAGSLFSEATQFSEFILDNYTKPSLVAYLLSEPSGNINNTCNWTEAGVGETYKFFFPYALPALLKRGTFGLALYRFNAVDDPLNCSSCRVGSNTDYMNTWFSFCQKYKSDVDNLPRGDMFAIFPNESTGSCLFASNPQYLGNFPFSGFGATVPQFTSVSVPNLSAKSDTFFRCDWCVNNESEWPTDLLVEPEGQPPDEYCTKYPELDYYADLRDLDPMLVRAISWTETSFNQCNVSTVSIGSDCNSRDLRNLKNDTEEYYPDGPGGSKKSFPKPLIEDKTGQFCPDVRSEQAPDGRKFCAYGLMQTIIYPGYVYDYYNENGIGLDPGDYAKLQHCFENGSVFNPFNSSHSACLGTWVYNNYLKWALPIVRGKNADRLNLVDATGAEDENKIRIAATYLSLLAYNRGPGGASGVFDTWINSFSGQSAADASLCNGDANDPEYCNGAGTLDACTGYKDFFKFVEECIWIKQEEAKKKADPNYQSKPNYPYVTLARYRALVKKCLLQDRTGCPPDTYVQNLIKKGLGSLPEVTQPQPQPLPP